MWTKESLQETIQSRMGDYRLLVASNRQPFRHTAEGGKIVCQREPGGLVTALHPVMEAAQGTWVAVGTSEYDRQVLDAHQKVMLPPGKSAYALRRIFLSKEDRNHYYYGYSNEGLWPLCHIAHTRPVFRESDWKAYQKVNRMFAEAILEEVGSQKTFVWIHDFHLVLVGKYLKEAGAANIVTSIFWHIPWPNPEMFRTCPQKNEILEGLLAYDLVGFQIRYHADNFLAAVDRELESRIDREKISVFVKDHETLVRPFPISVDFQAISAEAESEETRERGRRLREELSLGDKLLVVGVDRIDYTKGIPDKLRGIDRFLEKYPEFKEQFVFFQLGQISRIHLTRYKDLNDEINALVEEINWKHSQGSWVPIVFTRRYLSYQDILALYRLSDACVVSSLHDGMNLVAKEFVASRSDLNGSLILSQFTGSSREFVDAFLVNPYDTEALAEALRQALTLPPEERQRRMKKMREVVEQNNIYRWVGKVLSQLLKFEFQETG